MLAFAFLLGSLPSVWAALAFVTSEYNVQAGVPFEVVWEGAEGPVTLTLMSGPVDNLSAVETIAEDLDPDVTSFTWTPRANLPVATYAFRIYDAKSPDSPNFSVQWTLKESDEDLPSISSKSTAPPPPPETTQSTSSTSFAPTRSIGSTLSTLTKGAPETSKETTSEGSSTVSETEGGSTGPVNPPDTPTLSTGAKIGVGVGCGFVGLVLLVGLGFFIFRLGRKRGEAGQAVAKTMDSREDKPELSGESALVKHHQVQEMDAERGLQEMEADRGLHELDNPKKGHSIDSERSEDQVKKSQAVYEM